jgi:hypothetical protein
MVCVMKRLPLVLCALFAFAVSLSAHHSFESEFDTNKPIHIEGKITKVDWKNPHIYLELDTHVQIELTSPNHVLQAGWRRETFQPNMEIAVDGFSGKAASSATIGTAMLTIKATGQVLTVNRSDWHHSLKK